MPSRRLSSPRAGGRRPNLRPLVAGLALALAASGALASGTARDALASGDSVPTWSRDDFIAEATIPWGHPAAAGVLAALERVPPDRPAGTIVVVNCNDSGAGSLRQAVADAVSGDVVDLSQLTCSDITLTSGALVVAVDDLTLGGPGQTGLTSISAGHNSSLIIHTGNGTLGVVGLTLLNGGKYTTGSLNALGGCINSSGNVRMHETTVKYCVAQAQGTGTARGGAIRAAGDVALYSSVIESNSVVAGSGDASGGGVVAGGDLMLYRSTVRGNSVETSSSNPFHGLGSGVAGYGDVAITLSTVSGNSAPQGGAVLAAGTFGTHSAEFFQSTIADNVGTRSEFGAGIRLQTDARMVATTISGNREIRPAGAENKYGGGITTAGGVSVQSYSNVISGNFTRIDGTDFPSDIGRKGMSPVAFSNDDEAAASVIGWAHASITMPAHWLRSSTPRLGPLAWNGGPTRTMLPQKGSLLINANLISDPGGKADGDQRGPEFDRFVGRGLDIGAVETDTLFANGLQATP